MNDEAPRPVAGRDFPRNWDQFLDWFRDEAACTEYLERLRWPDGFVCPSCGAVGEPYQASRGRLLCRACQYQGSVTAGTVFEKTRTPLSTWFAAAWYVTNQKHGVSALGLQHALGLSSYQTAWTLLHRLRRAMIRRGRERLNGVVEIDESYVGGRDPPKRTRRRRKGKRRRRISKKVVVAIAVEVHDPRGFGRIRLGRMADASETSLLPFVRSAVEPGTEVHTDGSAAYRNLPKHGYPRRITVVSSSESPAHVSMPAVHRVAALLKRWLLGTHQGAVRPEQLDAYLDEFTFRFNRRTSRSRGLLFYRLLQQAVVTPPLTYHDIVEKKR